MQPCCAPKLSLDNVRSLMTQLQSNAPKDDFLYGDWSEELADGYASEMERTLLELDYEESQETHSKTEDTLAV